MSEPEKPKTQDQMNRDELAHDDEAFFNQPGAVTDALGETDTSWENRFRDRQPERGLDPGDVQPE